MKLFSMRIPDRGGARAKTRREAATERESTIV
jgi:hypothetical protein